MRQPHLGGAQLLFCPLALRDVGVDAHGANERPARKDRGRRYPEDSVLARQPVPDEHLIYRALAAQGPGEGFLPGAEARASVSMPGAELLGECAESAIQLPERAEAELLEGQPVGQGDPLGRADVDRVRHALEHRGEDSGPALSLGARCLSLIHLLFEFFLLFFELCTQGLRLLDLLFQL